MNRIYQGRVSSVAIANSDPATREPATWVALDADPTVAKEKGEISVRDSNRQFNME